MMHRPIVMIVTMFAAAGCNSSSFGGASPQTQAPPPQQGSPHTANSTACTGSGQTVAKLLTPTFQNGKPGNFLEYSLALTDCDGKPKPLSANKILFDVDAKVDALKSADDIHGALNYAVTIQSNTTTGQMASIQGSDLFNKTGPDYFHYETDQAVEGAPAEVRLHIDLGGRTMHPFPSNLISGPTQMATYLRYGDATPVAEVVSLQ